MVLISGCYTGIRCHPYWTHWTVCGAERMSSRLSWSTRLSTLSWGKTVQLNNERLLWMHSPTAGLNGGTQINETCWSCVKSELLKIGKPAGIQRENTWCLQNTNKNNSFFHKILEPGVQSHNRANVCVLGCWSKRLTRWVLRLCCGWSLSSLWWSTLLLRFGYERQQPWKWACRFSWKNRKRWRL